MDLSFAVNSPLLAENFTVMRSNGGSFGAGGWRDNYTTLAYYGVITPNGDPKEVEAIPEADRIHGVITINCELPLFVTRASGADGGPATSDIVQWNGDNYRVMKTHDYRSRGFWWAIAVRMAGA